MAKAKYTPATIVRNMSKLDPKVKKAWLAALRSKKYKQTTGALCKPIEGDAEAKGYCCLGVLCDLYAKANPGKAKWVKPKQRLIMDRNYTFKIIKGEIQEGLLPSQVAEWAKFGYQRASGFVADIEGSVTYKGEKHSFPTLNDNYRLSFEEIATLIDKQL